MKRNPSESHPPTLEVLSHKLKGNRRYLWAKWMHSARGAIMRVVTRLLEMTVAGLLFCFLTVPVAAILLIRRMATGKPVMYRHHNCSQGQSETSPPRFAVRNHLIASLPSLFLVFVGRLSLVGRYSKLPRGTQSGSQGAYIKAVKPGLVTLWGIRSRARIGHEGRMATDWEYRFTRSLKNDLMILLRALLSLPFGNAAGASVRDMQLFGIRLPNLTMSEAVARVEHAMQGGKTAEPVFFVNPDCLNKTFSDPEYAAILRSADHVLPDGIGLTVAGKILGTPLRQNVNGTDMLPFLCAMLAKNSQSLFLLGGQPGVAERMAEKLVATYGVKIAGTHHGYFDHQSASGPVIDLINRSGADLVLVAFGAPLQEKWITAHRQHLEVGAVLGVGGLFDFYSGKTKRAPRWLREIGLEWAYRILQEPGRMWRRYVIGNPLFLFRVIVWKHRMKINHAK